MGHDAAHERIGEQHGDGDEGDDEEGLQDEMEENAMLQEHLRRPTGVDGGELLFGLARRPDATRLHRVIDEFRRRVDVLPWDSSVAPVYGDLRASLASNGTLIGALDLLIAAHALAADRILVTSDRDFARIARLNTQDWTG